MCFFLKTHTGERSGFGGYFYDQQKGLPVAYQ